MKWCKHFIYRCSSQLGSTLAKKTPLKLSHWILNGLKKKANNWIISQDKQQVPILPASDSLPHPFTPSVNPWRTCPVPKLSQEVSKHWKPQLSESSFSVLLTCPHVQSLIPSSPLNPNTITRSRGYNIQKTKEQQNTFEMRDYLLYPKWGLQEWTGLQESSTCSSPLLTTLPLLLLRRVGRVRLCATPQTAAHQAPPSLGFSRQEHWSGVPFPPPITCLRCRKVLHDCATHH